MIDPLWFLFFIAYLFHYLPLWFFVTSLITVVHTVEEVTGEIWEELGIPAILYYAFQLLVLILGTALWWYPVILPIFCGIRLIDTFGTHWLLKKPGILTSPLLLLDAIVLWNI